jgi:hypothetical protein
MTYIFLRAKRIMELMATRNKCPPALSYNVTLCTSSKREKNSAKWRQVSFFSFRGQGRDLSQQHQKPPKEAVKHPVAVPFCLLVSMKRNSRRLCGQENVVLQSKTTRCPSWNAAALRHRLNASPFSTRVKV